MHPFTPADQLLIVCIGIEWYYKCVQLYFIISYLKLVALNLLLQFTEKGVDPSLT